jgi:hypothetical protein
MKLVPLLIKNKLLKIQLFHKEVEASLAGVCIEGMRVYLVELSVPEIDVDPDLGWFQR